MIKTKIGVKEFRKKAHKFMLCTTLQFFQQYTASIDTVYIYLPSRTNIILIDMLDSSQDFLLILLCAFVPVVIIWVTLNKLFHTC